MGQERLLRIGVEARVNGNDLVQLRIELRADRKQCQRHRKKDRVRIVEHDFVPLAWYSARHAKAPIANRTDSAPAPISPRSRHIEHTQVRHSARAPARIDPRNARMRSPFSARERLSVDEPSRSDDPPAGNVASAGPEIKKHGCTRPVAPTTAENSGALQRTAG